MLLLLQSNSCQYSTPTPITLPLPFCEHLFDLSETRPAVPQGDPAIVELDQCEHEQLFPMQRECVIESLQNCALQTLLFSSSVLASRDARRSLVRCLRCKLHMYKHFDCAVAFVRCYRS